MYRQNASGFTLVELAIVLMIIGLLIGGILRGQELMENTRVTSTIRQVNSYNGAVYTFQDAYGAYPGDIATATTRIPGCTVGNTNGCVNGNGNGVIGNLGNIWEGGQQAIATENTQFWKHLAMAHLISGIKPSALQPNWGDSHPVSPFNGGFTVITATSGGGAQQMFGGMLLRLHSCLTCGNVEESNGANGSPVSPKHAGMIDRKMDDGLPGTGDVQSAAMGNGAAVAMCEEAYTASEVPFCVMSFMIKR